MIQTAYMQEKMNDEILIFEVIDKWYMGPNGLTQLNIASPQGTLSYLDDRYEGFYRGLDWTYENVVLTANPLAALQFDSIEDDFAKSILNNFPSGHFKKVKLQSQITDIQEG